MDNAEIDETAGQRNEVKILNTLEFAHERLGAYPLMRNEKDDSLLILIPAGKFLAGDEEFEVELPSFYLGIHPVTNSQYALFLNDQKLNENELIEWILLDNHSCFIRSSNSGYETFAGKGNHPVVQVSWRGATAYCNWVGGRLPRELEWEKAARSADGRQYPWGDDWDQSKCRNDENRGGDTTCGVWGYAEGCSPFGLYQMSGNVWEWCEDWYGYYLDSNVAEDFLNDLVTDPKGPSFGKYRVFRGGSWVLPFSRRCRSANRDSGNPDGHYSLSGFRLVRDF